MFHDPPHLPRPNPRRENGERRMNQETRYRYEKRIRELQRDVDALRDYKRIGANIYDAVCGQIQDGKQISMAWIIRQFKDAWK